MKKWMLLPLSLLLICLSIGGLLLARDHDGEKRLKFGATYMTMNNPFFEVLDENIKEIVESNGDIMITRDPLQDQEKQNAEIEEMLAEGIDVLFLNPVDWKKVGPAVKLCKEKGVPVFVIDTEIYDDGYAVSTILSDNYEAGVRCAEDMMKKTDRADIVIIYEENIRSTTERVRGFLDTIKTGEGYRIRAEKKNVSDLETAMEEMKRVINGGIPFDTVFCGNDPTALGAVAAMQKLNKEGTVRVYGVDGSPDAKVLIGAGYLEATGAQSPVRMGITAAKTAYGYLKGKIPAKVIKIPVSLITKKNLKNYSLSGWQ